VDRPENVIETRLVRRVFLQFDHGSIEEIEVLVTLDEEFFDNFVHGIGRDVLTSTQSSRCTPAPTG
jgi:hypothetical protein